MLVLRNPKCWRWIDGQYKSQDTLNLRQVYCCTKDCPSFQKYYHSKDTISFSISFLFHLPFSSSFEIIRQQFPLRRAFALTFNKSQGQTLDKVLLDVRGHLFNHGYLYVGMSRVQLYSQVAFYISNNEYDDVGGKCIVGNIVYEDVLKVSERR